MRQTKLHQTYYKLGGEILVNCDITNNRELPRKLAYINVMFFYFVASFVFYVIVWAPPKSQQPFFKTVS